METGDPHAKAELGTGRPEADPPHCRGPTMDKLRNSQEPAEERLRNRLALLEEVGEGGWTGTLEA